MPRIPEFDFETPVQNLLGDDVIEQMLFLAGCRDKKGRVQVNCPDLPADIDLDRRLTNLISYTSTMMRNLHLMGGERPAFFPMSERRR
jgi:hypothetical protein